jgi:uroporphyrin-3 C-methyltransferase
MIDDAAEADAAAPPQRRRRLPPLAVLATIVALAALALAAWTAWRVEHAARAEASQHQRDAATIANLHSQLVAGSEQAQAGGRRIAGIESGLDDLRASVQGQGRRIANLESGFATLSGQQQSAHDTVLLNDTETLLRGAEQRYQLFHDSAGALKAYRQAIDVLAQVRNPAYAPVRASAITERDALAAAAPPSRQAALDALSTLRNELGELPLASMTPATAASSAPGFWSRVGRAFSGIVTVSREPGATASLTDVRFARQDLALDLAQAQEALLAFDQASYRSALTNGEAVLAAQFDGGNAAVKRARATLDRLLAQHATGPAPTLGGALAQLQSVRASQSPAVPATAASSGAAKP